jgi:hypothetical protein
MTDKPLEPRLLFYLLSFFIPLVGIILGIIYISSAGTSSKEFGKMCLIFGLLGIVLGGLVCWVGPCGFCGFCGHHYYTPGYHCGCL